MAAFRLFVADLFFTTTQVGFAGSRVLSHGEGVIMHTVDYTFSPLCSYSRSSFEARRALARQFTSILAAKLR